MNERMTQGAKFPAAPLHHIGGMLDPGRVSVALEPVPASVAAARRTVDTLLADADPSDEFRLRLRLVVSELMTNAVVHGSPTRTIRLDLTLYGDHAHVSIHNAGEPIDITELRQGRPDGGRGLDLVTAIADRWGIDTGPGGTTISARVPRLV
jgi:anti-sigma regulatory factor (Ser/Thr protein kinase)